VTAHGILTATRMVTSIIPNTGRHPQTPMPRSNGLRPEAQSTAAHPRRAMRARDVRRGAPADWSEAGLP
jgi:hypothetical protein